MTDNARDTPERPAKGVPAPWDYYYLRYFVGAIVGAGLLVVLWVGDPRVLSSLPHMLPPAPHEWLDLAAVIAALGTAGLAYCYIASAPILLLHGLRLLVPSEQRWWRRWLQVPFGVIVILLGVFAWLWGGSPPSGFRKELLGRWLLYMPYAVVVLLQAGILAVGAIEPVRRRYTDLARHRARAGHEAWIGEYKESYRHLREHGNALLIILMEVILGAALYAADSTIRFFTLAVIWIVPAAFCWFLGTWLEFGLVPDKANARSAQRAPELRLGECQAKAFAELPDMTGLSRSELLNEAVDDLVDKYRRKSSPPP